MPAATPLTPQDVADAVNSLGVSKADFTAFLAAAALLQKRESLSARIAATNAQAQQATAAAQQAAQQLQQEYAAVQQQIQGAAPGP